MHTDIEKLSQMLNLTAYQRGVLESGAGEYNFGRLEKRGGVLYAPRRAGGFLGAIAHITRGPRADLIGKNKTLLHAVRGIKFSAGGYHCVRIGRYKYYADPDGQAVSRDIFMRAMEKLR